MMNPKRIRGRLPALWLLATAVGLAALFVLRGWSPGNDSSDSICALRRVFGLACPTCGLTRAFAELAKGRYGAASRFHPFASVLAAELGLAWGILGAAIFRPGWPLPRRAAIPVLLVTVAALVVVWIYRLAAGTLPP